MEESLTSQMNAGNGEFHFAEEAWEKVHVTAFNTGQVRPFQCSLQKPNRMLQPLFKPATRVHDTKIKYF